MTKELEYVEKILRWYEYNFSQLNRERNQEHIEQLYNIKQALIKAQKQEKALEIILEKEVSIFQLKYCKNVYSYNDLRFRDCEILTPREFDLLIEVLCND